MVVIISRVYTYVNTDQIVHFKYVQFILLQLNYNKVFFLKKLDEITNGISVDKEQKPKAGP